MNRLEHSAVGAARRYPRTLAYLAFVSTLHLILDACGAFR